MAGCVPGARLWGEEGRWMLKIQEARELTEQDSRQLRVRDSSLEYVFLSFCEHTVEKLLNF